MFTVWRWGIIVSLISAPPNAASNSRPDSCRMALAKRSLVSLGLKGITVMLRMFGFDRRAVVPPKLVRFLNEFTYLHRKFT